jgi:hypothetical protein
MIRPRVKKPRLSFRASVHPTNRVITICQDNALKSGDSVVVQFENNNNRDGPLSGPVVALGKEFPAKAAQSRVALLGEMVDVPEPVFMRSVVNVPIDYSSEGVEVRFLFFDGIHLLFFQNAIGLQVAHKTYRIFFCERKISERSYFPRIFGFFGNILQSAHFQIEKRGFNESGGGISGIFESARESIALIGTNQMALNSARSLRWSKTKIGGYFARSNDNPSPFRISHSLYLPTRHKYVSQSQDDEGECEGSHNPIARNVPSENMYARLVLGFVFVTLGLVVEYLGIRALFDWVRFPFGVPVFIVAYIGGYVIGFMGLGMLLMGRFLPERDQCNKPNHKYQSQHADTVSCGFLVLRLQQFDDFQYAPNMVSDARFHRGSHAQCLVNTAKVVVHEVNRNRIEVIFNFLAEPICKARKSAHSHPHREILALNEAG